MESPLAISTVGQQAVPSIALMPAAATVPTPAVVEEVKEPHVKKFPDRVELIFTDAASKIAYIFSLTTKLEEGGIKAGQYLSVGNKTQVIIRAEAAVLKQIEALVNPSEPSAGLSPVV